jgi:hypothetical protein
VDSALVNIEWTVTGILASDFPIRPHPEKFSKCDFQAICPGTPDIVFRKARIAVFVDGDFWHGYRFPSWEDKVSDF